MSEQHPTSPATGDDDLRTLFDAQTAAPSSGIDAAIRSAAARVVQAPIGTDFNGTEKQAVPAETARPAMKLFPVVSLAAAASLVTALTFWWSLLQPPEQPTLRLAEADQRRVIVAPLALDTTTEFEFDSAASTRAREARTAETRSTAKSALAEDRQLASRQASHASAASQAISNPEMHSSNQFLDEGNTPALQLGVVIEHLQLGERQQARAAWMLFEQRYPLIAAHLDLALLEANVYLVPNADKR